MSEQTIKTIKVQAGQSVADIATQEYGTVEGMILILQANPGLSVSSELTAGQELVIFTTKAINLVKELVKTEAFGSELQSMLMKWIKLVIFPTIPQPVAQVNSDWNATEGAALILNKPTIPQAISERFIILNAIISTSSISAVDTGLELSVSAGIYEFEATLFAQSDSTSSGIAFGVTLTTSYGSVRYGITGAKTASTTYSVWGGNLSLNIPGFLTSANNPGMVKIKGLISSQRDQIFKIRFNKVTSGWASINGDSFLKIKQIS